jgi:hypothetical protein
MENYPEQIVTMPLKRYNELLDNETRNYILAAYTKSKRFSIERETIALILDFELGKADE